MVPHTCIAMSSSVRIYSKNGRTGNPSQIGLIQSFRPTDTRRMERARGIGYGDRVAEIVPGMTEVAITITRMALYEENILETLGYHSVWNKGDNLRSVRTLAHTKNPLDIMEQIVFHANKGSPGIGNLRGGFGRGAAGVDEAGSNSFSFPKDNTTIWYKDCWINNYARTIEVTGNLIYMEDVGVDVTWVDDGCEPLPYQDTDVWDIHGLGCNSANFYNGSGDSSVILQGFAAGSFGQAPGLFANSETSTRGTDGNQPTFNVSLGPTIGQDGSSVTHRSLGDF